MKRQQGFTLIELIMVIVILGILAAVAVPRFADISVDARRASLRSLEGSMRSTNTMVYARAVSTIPSQTGATGTVTMGNVTLNTIFGYAATATDLASVMELNAADFAASGTDIQMISAPTPGGCQVTYAAPNAAGDLPTYTQTDTGC
ncbi:MAG: type II secretion system protein [Methylococcaceae bacterium]|nr:MAG: type II secretion system protein [Methylococcaceae bacterium]